MKLKLLIRVALRELGRNKLRSSLTMLGVVIGVASVVTMVSVGQGATASVKSSISKMGNNMLYVRSGSVSSGGIYWGAGSMKTLTARDSDAIKRESPSITASSPIVRQRLQVVYGDRNWVPGELKGAGADYPFVKNWPASDGRWFTEQEVRSGAKVAMVGQTIVKELFGGNSPLDETIRIGRVPIRIIGVMSKRGANTWGRDQDDSIILPWTTVKTRLGKADTGLKTVDRIVVSVISIAAIERAKREITAILRERHRIRPGQADDFQIRDLALYTDAFTQTTRTMTMLLSAIASISLLVGGIGIMNIMLVSVSERTREIGIRLAVGARSRDIMRQFLVEAIVLALLGGAIGIILGVSLSKGISLIARWPTLISMSSIVVAIGFSTAIGVIFGYYPARRAASLDPIESLRYE